MWRYPCENDNNIWMMALDLDLDATGKSDSIPEKWKAA